MRTDRPLIIYGPRRRRARIGPRALVLAGIALVALPRAQAALASLGQFERGAAQDRSLPTYRHALAVAYDGLFTPPPATTSSATHARDLEDLEEPVVSFAAGARPAPARPQPAFGSPRRFESFRIRIPRIRLDQPVREGVSRAALRNGPGHYPGTALPGQVGNVVVSGHRTGFTQPFYDLDRLRPGDLVYLDAPSRAYAYRIERVFVVETTEVTPLADADYEKLTLTTCHPKHTSRQRLIVEARLIFT